MNNNIRQMLEDQGIYIKDKDVSEKVVFVFPGHGAQYAGMFKELYENVNVIHEVFDKAEKKYVSLAGNSLLDKIFSKEEAEADLLKPTVMQPSIILADVAMYEYIVSLGYKPNYLLGHSLGEIAALCAAKVFSIEEAIEIAYRRAEAVEIIPKEKRGGMISIGAEYNVTLATELLKAGGADCEISIINSNKQFNISGSTEAIYKIKKYCDEKSITGIILKVSHAFHSQIMAPSVKPYREAIENFNFNKPQFPVYSTILSKIYDEEMLDSKNFAEILANQLVTPFSFKDIVNRLVDTYSAGYFVEVGPNDIMTKLVKAIEGDRVYTMSTNRKKHNELEEIEIFKVKAFCFGMKFVEDMNVITIKDKEMDNIINVFSYETMYPIRVFNEFNKPVFNYYAISDEVRDKIVYSLSNKYNLILSSEELMEISLNGIYEKIVLGERKGSIVTYTNKSVSKIGVAIDRIDIKDYVIRVIEENTGYPKDMLDDNLDFEADLGIDSVKQGEILSAVQDKYQYEVEEGENIKELSNVSKVVEYVVEKIGREADISPLLERDGVTENQVVPEVVQVDTRKIKEYIIQVIEENTGYPKDMLDDNLDFEADLGIDSVKQGEILSVIQNKYQYEMEEGENIKELSNVSKVAEYVAGKIGREADISPLLERDGVTENQVVPEVVQVDTREIKEYIIQVIEKNTGYPKDMLNDNLDFEADLGIDSVKQGEILSEIQNRYQYKIYEGEQVKELSTVSKVLDYVVEKINNKDECSNKMMTTSGSDNKLKIKKKYIYRDEGFVSKRYVAIPMKKHMNKEVNFTVDKKNVLLVADEDGVLTEALYQELNNTAASVSVISEKKLFGVADKDLNICKYNDSEKLKEITKNINNKFHVNIIVNLSAVRKKFDFNNLSVEDWKKQYFSVYNSNFYISKVVYSNLEVDKENTAYFAITNIGGIYGMEKGYEGNPVGAISAGFVKALEKELRPLKCKVIDFSTVNDIVETVSIIKEEISRIENFVEVGYDIEGRKIVEVLPKEIRDNVIVNEVTDDDIILVTGGGRGIIYECVNALLEHVSPKIIVTGRTSLPDKNTKEMSMTDEEFKAYREEFFKMQHALDANISPVLIQRKYEKLVNARLLLANFAKWEEKGYEVEYFVCDAAEQYDMEALVKHVKKKYGKITGIINGAGLPSFGKIPKKDEKFAERVVEVKANSSFILMKECMKEPLKFFISMGSISGRFGMDGQVDYSAAADLIVRMTMLASQLKPETRFTVMGWSAWDEVGMASSEQVKKIQKGTRGLEYLSVKEGTTRFLNEIFYGGNYPEVLIFGELGDSNLPLGQMDALNFDKKNITNIISSKENIVIDRIKYPMIEKIISFDDKKIIASKYLTIENDMHLQDHKVEGKHVFAGVMHVETACEMLEMYLYRNGLSDYKISDISGFNFYKFIKIFKGNPLELILEGIITEKNTDNIKMHVTLKSDFISRKGIVIEKERLHSEGDVIAVKGYNINIKKDLVETQGQELYLDRYYNQASEAITFGNSFKCINSVRIINNNEIIGKITVPMDGQYFAFTRNADTCISPITIDNIGRLMLFREFNLNGYTIVPTFIDEAKQYRQMIPGEELDAYCRFEAEDGMNVIYSASALDKEGNLVFDIKNMRLRRINKYNGDYSLCNETEKYPAIV